MSYAKEALINLLKVIKILYIDYYSTVIHIYKKHDQRRKKKFSRVNIARPEMGKQNKQYMYKLQRSVHITDKSKQSALQASMKW